MSLSSDLAKPHDADLQADPDELASAMGACDFPLVVWTAPDAVIRLANRDAAELLGLTLKELIGRNLHDLVEPDRAVSDVVAMVAAGELSNISSVRRLRAVDVPVNVWTRSVQLDDQRGGVSLFVPVDQVCRLGRDPTSPLRDLYPVAVGLVLHDWRVTAVSSEIRDLTAYEPSQVIGHDLLELVHHDDQVKLTGPEGAPPRDPQSPCRVRLKNQLRGWVESCWLTAPAENDGCAFAVLSAPRTSSAERIAELELRLRRIAAEVRAAGVLNNIATMPSAVTLDDLPELSTRQWEILSLLLRGRRVPTIARDLYVSQSTVRNHLTAIFRKFGVRSQAELLEALQRRR